VSIRDSMQCHRQCIESKRFARGTAWFESKRRDLGETIQPSDQGFIVQKNRSLSRIWQ